MSAVACGFVRRANWLRNLDGGPFRSYTPFEQHIADCLRGEAAYLIGFMAS